MTSHAWSLNVIGESSHIPSSTAISVLFVASPSHADALRAALAGARAGAIELAHAERLATGLAMLAKRHYDLVIVDDELSDGRGLEAYRQLRARGTGTRVVVLTRTDDGASAVQYLAEGADGIVGMPPQKDVLLAAIDRVIEHREQELRLLQAQQLVGVGWLAGGIAHDLNNLLAVAQTNLSLLRPERPDLIEEVRDEIQAALTLAARSIRRLQVIRDPARFVTLDVNEVVAEFLGLAKRMLDPEITLEQQLCAAAPILGDRAMLEQLVLNLVINARAAITGRGTVRVQTSFERVPLEVASRTPGAYAGAFVRLSVSDTGIGMSREALDRIWTPGFTTKGDGQGGGLGLAVVRSIVVAHRGWVHVDSRPGTGSTFDVFLPAAS